VLRRDVPRLARHRLLGRDGIGVRGERLEFGRGLSAEDEPDLFRRDLTGTLEQWIDVGLPDEREVRKACGRVREVIVYAYGGRASALWWDKAGPALARQPTLAVWDVPAEASQALAALAARTMRLQFTIQDGHVLATDGDRTVGVDLVALKPPG